MTDATLTYPPVRARAGFAARALTASCRRSAYPRACWFSGKPPSVCSTCRPLCCRRQRAIVASLIANRSTLAVAAQATALEVLFGFVLSAFVGILVALVIVRFERFGNALYPLIVLFQNVPKVALAPIFILWFGYDLAPKILLIVVIAFFPVDDRHAGRTAVGRAVLCGADALGRRQQG